MTTATQASTERINLRIQAHSKQLLERAAGFEGQTMSGFILNSALAQAERTILEHDVIHLSAQDSQAFLAALERPVQFNEALTRALANHQRLVTSR